MTTPAKGYERRCGKCAALYRTDDKGALWFNRKANPRYVHPGCESPKPDWKSAAAAGVC